MRTFVLIILSHFTLTLLSQALTYGLFTYTDDGTSITITDYPTTATGDVVIPETIDGKPVTAIGDSAFIECKSLSTIEIPASVTEIGNQAFEDCPRLTSIHVATGNTTYASSDGMLFTNDFSTLLECPDGKQGLVSIPESTTTITPLAFRDCRAITGVSIPASVTDIELAPFWDCHELETIDVHLDNAEFSSLEGILYDKHKTFIIRCPERFQGALSIPETVLSMGPFVFYNCRRLTSVSIPDSITSIPPNTFLRCSSLTNLSLPTTLTSIGYAAFEECVRLEAISLPNTLTSINLSAFRRCASLTQITIPASATVAHVALADCYALTNFAIPESVSGIDLYSFSSCLELTSISVPSTTQSMAPGAIIDCPKLAIIDIDPANPYLTNHDGLVYSKDMTTLIRCPPAFSGALHLPATVTSIQNGAFDGCSAIDSITVDPANANFSTLGGILLDNDQSTLIFSPAGIAGNLLIPSTVTHLESRALEHGPAVTTIQVDPNNPTFSSSGGILFNKSQTTLIRCPAGFVGSVEIPATVTTIERKAFDDCVSVPEITVAIENTSYTSLDGVLYNSGLSELIKCPAGFSGTLDLPTSVIKITQNACSGCTNLTAISLPSSLPKIDSNAFLGCTGLTSITIPDSVTELIWWCFFGCSNLTEITFLGDAPQPSGPFYSGSPDNLLIQHFENATGFPSRNWNGYPTTNMGVETPVKTWLINEGLGYDQNPEDDLNGDGVALLTAYALGLDPRQHLAAQMPKPRWTGSGLSIEFYAAAPGITYTVKCSDDLINWTTIGVDLSPVDVDGMRNATLPVAENRRFMRLVFAE